METNISKHSIIKDVQNSEPLFKKKIDFVGIKNLRYPIMALSKVNGILNTIADISIFVDLSPYQRGTHMSRFIETLNCYISQPFCLNVMENLAKKIQSTLNANAVFIEIKYPIFIEKKAPVSKKISLLEYECKMIYNQIGCNIDRMIGITVPMTSLCPCSKEISDFGAHNQRGFITVVVKVAEALWIEDLISLIENETSCEIFPLLKRIDEKYVTEKAYLNPGFVEDIVRKVYFALKKLKNVTGLQIEVENQESIHSHNAYAKINSLNEY